MAAVQSGTTLYSVFVYGTLKQGEPNHYLISERLGTDAKFIGAAATVDSYPLIIASKYNIPFLLDKKGIGHNVEGEVYEVNSVMLEKLDELENHPEYYKRRMEPVKFSGDSNHVLKDCWIYFLPKFRESLLDNEYLQSYSAKGPHGKEYVASKDDRLEDLWELLNMN